MGSCPETDIDPKFLYPNSNYWQQHWYLNVLLMQQVCLSEQQLQLRPSICNVNSYLALVIIYHLWASVGWGRGVGILGLRLCHTKLIPPHLQSIFHRPPLNTLLTMLNPPLFTQVIFLNFQIFKLTSTSISLH